MPAIGQLIKTMSSASAYTFPVGDGSFYTPVTATPSGTSGSVSVAVENAAPSNLGTNPNYLTRNWRVNTTGFTSNALVGTYNQTNDVVGTEALIKGATLTGMTWSFTGSTGNVGTDMVGATAPMGDVVFSGLTTLGSVKLRAFLTAAYTGSNTMSTTLRNLVLLPPGSPYGDGASVGTMNSDVPAGVVDWVLLEISNPNNLGDPTILKGAFIKSDGFIVDLDGVSDPQILGAYNPAIVRLKHRNHLSIRTNNEIDTQAPVLQDFTINSNVYADMAISNGPQNALAGGKWGLWAGDANGNGTVSYTGGTHDRDAILLALSFNPNNSLTNVYNKADVNMNGTVSYTGGTHDRDAILLFLGFNPNSSKKQH